MKTKILLPLCLLATLVPGARAQTTPVSIDAPASGTHEFTLGASGVSNKDFDDSFGGLNFSYGTYWNQYLEGSIRQSINYSNPSDDDSAWNGSTRLAVDQHFGDARLRPFVGVNVGGIYGENVRDSFAAGVEAGGKYYVQSRTFVYLMAEYDWTFRHASEVDNRFDDGQFNWNVGVGFNF
jgi:hypothetical protein